MKPRLSSSSRLMYATKGAVVTYQGSYGHVIGFDIVKYDNGYETILKVCWDDGDTTSIHPDNLKFVTLEGLV